MLLRGYHVREWPPCIVLAQAVLKHISIQIVLLQPVTETCSDLGVACFSVHGSNVGCATHLRLVKHHYNRPTLHTG